MYWIKLGNDFKLFHSLWDSMSSVKDVGIIEPTCLYMSPGYGTNIALLSLSGWKARCVEYFPYSTYFGGRCSSSAVPHGAGQEINNAPESGRMNHCREDKHGDARSLNGNVEAFKELTF